MTRPSPQDSARPRTVIIGAGFAGLYAAKALARTATDVLLIDRSNHHLFQPLLYQVATAALSPAQIAQPIRRILKKQANVTVGLSEVTGIDTTRKVVVTSAGEAPYDYLVLATGATHTYFNHPEWAPYAPGLKTVNDALQMRQRILDAFEQAEVSQDPDEQKALLTFVLVGAGPTGVEMAGAIAELAQHTLKGEFRRINPADARVVLVEAGPRVLASFPESLSRVVQHDLEKLGVTVMTGQTVTQCNAEGARVGETWIACRTIIWSAGVKASPAAAWLGVAADRAGRIQVGADLQVPGHAEIFAVGDTAQVVDGHGITVPGLAPAAMQQGRYVARQIARRLTGQPGLPPFVYRDWGTMATIGRGRAIAQIFGYSLHGLFAWVLWGLVHIMPLVGFRNRVLIATDWLWCYFTGARSVRLMTVGTSLRD